jgi:hypothetical protein
MYVRCDDEREPMFSIDEGKMYWRERDAALILECLGLNWLRPTRAERRFSDLVWTLGEDLVVLIMVACQFHYQYQCLVALWQPGDLYVLALLWCPVE